MSHFIYSRVNLRRLQNIETAPKNPARAQMEMVLGSGASRFSPRAAYLAIQVQVDMSLGFGIAVMVMVDIPDQS
jgi:hypothetical protein